MSPSVGSGGSLASALLTQQDPLADGSSFSVASGESLGFPRSDPPGGERRTVWAWGAKPRQSVLPEALSVAPVRGRVRIRARAALMVTSGRRAANARAHSKQALPDGCMATNMGYPVLPAMPYLNCPDCRLSVYSPPAAPPQKRCPRCNARLGTSARALFATELPDRLLDATRRQMQQRQRAN